MRSQVLEGHNPAVGESHDLARVRNSRRKVRIIKRIVQRSPEIWVPWPVTRVGRRVVNVNPGLPSTGPHVADNFSIGRTPREPHSGSWHAGANLSLANQCLVSGRNTLVEIRMLRNSRLRGGTTHQNERAHREAECRCTKENPTPHAREQTISASNLASQTVHLLIRPDSADPVGSNAGSSPPPPDQVLSIGATAAPGIGRRQLCPWRK